MTARVLVVDDIPANRKLLEVRLTAEYFEVTTASDGFQALEVCARAQCDIVLLDVMMPGMDGFEVCRRLKTDPKTHHIPVIIVTALDQPADRVRGLEAGADDFLTKPVVDVALFARVRSLARLKMLGDELRLRAQTTREIGLSDALMEAVSDPGMDGRVLLVDDRENSWRRIAAALAASQTVDVETSPQEALFRAAEGDYDVVLVSLSLDGFDALRLCAQLRSLERTRMTPVVLIAGPDDNARVLRGLEVGVNDYVVRPLDPAELTARIRTQVRRKRYTAQLRSNLQASMELAITDGLTGLHNRRYMEMHLQSLLDQATGRGRPLSALVVDIDFFKSVNDSYGHDAGDDVLREFSRRLKASVRGIDLACRLGGEEFVVIMPETDAAVAQIVAERIRSKTAAAPFAISGGQRSIEVTVSIGVASFLGAEDDAAALLKRADLALYRAKAAGRNRVVADAA
ncbi:PleD family two-component system response regulator [Hansschlegelia sp.]|uniref:PleD family two-component system response regulator n=1 Tax=Hansschlegelia sp. TaxID=2041892 RepID=UPI002C748F23|nr:PleD family two-component system response regulator [Hansschlegelia sp.]HVI27380.1 PleD family two-component system response regulator [Hansschlegelia sp.]